jgi:chromosomal replication initiation ATPase DnaA
MVMFVILEKQKTLKIGIEIIYIGQKTIKQHRIKITIKSVKESLCNYFNLKENMLYEKSTSKKKTIPKYYFTYLLKNFLNISYSKIDEILKTKGSQFYRNKVELNEDIITYILNDSIKK